MSRRRRVVIAIVAMAFGVPGCTTVYTEADLPELESRDEAQLGSEEMNDEEIGAEGGTNLETLRDQEEEAERSAER